MMHLSVQILIKLLRVTVQYKHCTVAHVRYNTNTDILKRSQTKVMLTLLTLHHLFFPLSGELICYATIQTDMMR